MRRFSVILEWSAVAGAVYFIKFRAGAGAGCGKFCVLECGCGCGVRRIFISRVGLFLKDATLIHN